ncbi:MAG: ATP-binding cassette domain-containing protein [Ignavibacteriae bacterium]|nr:ATP-binding cassette domain-containing protein [Ignavibacteriota bacterium]
MLEIKNISKLYNSKPVLDGLSFEVTKDRIFGLIGPNGAGKTTTLRIILNIILPSTGEIYFGGEKLDQRYLNQTGYLPEERGLYPKSKVINTLVYLAQLKGLTSSEANKQSNYWLNRLNLISYKNHNLEELSKGNQQKVQFISAIQHNPKVLVLDEPFSGFDPVNQSIFTEILQEIKKDKFVILSTHLMDLAESLCDDFVLINKGKEVLKGELKKTLNLLDKNIYEIIFDNNFKMENLENQKDITILKKFDNKIQIEIHNAIPSEVLRKLSSENSILEFKKIIPSLHQLFISQVEEK